MRRCVALFAKRPEAGKVKTRLQSACSPSEAAHLYRAFLLDTANTVSAVRAEEKVIAYAPTGAEEFLRDLLCEAGSFTYVAQRDGTLGERMQDVIDGALGRGAERVVLLGYSMGCTVCTNFLANHEAPEVVGLCTIAHPMSLPQSLRERWQRYGATPTYDEVAEYARPIVAGDLDDPPGDRIFTVMRANGPLPTPENGEIWTYATWWSSRGPESPHAESREQIGRVHVPIAILQAGNDHLIQAGEGYELARIAAAAGNHEVFLDMVPQADHVFTGCVDVVSDMAARWLADLA